MIGNCDNYMERIIIFILTMFFLLFGCTLKKANEDEIYYVIKHPITIAQDTCDVPPPKPPALTYYGNFNFILLDSSTIYFHSQHIQRFCGTGIDDSKPPRVFLTSESLIKLDINLLPQFLTNSITDSLASGKRFFASISSPTDTIRNRAFKIISDFFKSKNIVRYNIRNWTEEERFVTTAKIENKSYNPDSVEWIIGFDFNFNPTKYKTNGE